jgi:hypothetical protein
VEFLKSVSERFAMKELLIVLLVIVSSVGVSHQLPTEQKYRLEMIERERSMQAEVDAACGVI